MSSRTTVVRPVLVLNPELPAWLLANTAAVLGASIGSRERVHIGPDTSDASGTTWQGIAEIGVPVLAASPKELAELRDLAQQAGLTALAFTEDAQGSRTYEQYTAAIVTKTTHEMVVHGLALLGDSRRIRKLTKDLLPLGS
ncbi:DUF2000 domain-containing protein [Lentzea sp. NPDC058450]|uniref:DUF2000 domain-containing protein n=1 Tax=Lentzea sp. NPDC058450 TaxID=3346505 RepID=UPI003656C442